MKFLLFFSKYNACDSYKLHEMLLIPCKLPCAACNSYFTIAACQAIITEFQNVVDPFHAVVQNFSQKWVLKRFAPWDLVPTEQRRSNLTELHRAF